MKVNSHRIEEQPSLTHASALLVAWSCVISPNDRCIFPLYLSGGLGGLCRSCSNLWCGHFIGPPASAPAGVNYMQPLFPGAHTAHLMPTLSALAQPHFGHTARPSVWICTAEHPRPPFGLYPPVVSGPLQRHLHVDFPGPIPKWLPIL